MALSVVILAAGSGKRMHSDHPKVLHSLAGKALLEHVVQTASLLNPDQAPYVVYGHLGDRVRQTLSDLNVQWVLQEEQLGTGHALLQALPHIPDHHQVLTLYGDVPCISHETLSHFIANTPKMALGIITAHFANPAGFGRIIRDAHHSILHIVEERDARVTERLIKEINSGIYLANAAKLKEWLPRLQKENTQQEYYLTDIVKIAALNKIPICSHQPEDPDEVIGINDRIALARMERLLQKRRTEHLMRQGVTFYDPERFDLRGELTVGRDVTIDINVIIEGHVTIGNHAIIGPHSILRNVIIGDHVEIKAHSILDGAEIGHGAIVGPFARIRPGTILADHVHIGNFVEIKNSFIGAYSKAHHLSYLGDSELGTRVNIGAGTITCNYDGVNKHKTIIGDGAFIGSNSELVAPLTIGMHATIGAGSTITRDAPANQLTVARAEQRTIQNWKRKQKEVS